MRVCIVSEHYAVRTDGGTLCIGGSELMAYRIACGLADRHEVRVITSREPDTPAHETFDGHEVFRVGPAFPYAQFGDRRRRFQFVMAARREVASRPADVVLNSSLLTAWPANAGARTLGSPAVTIVFDVFLERWRELVSPAFAPVASRLERWLLALPWARYLPISGPTRELLRAAGIDGDAVEIVPPPVDTEIVRATPPLARGDGPVIGYVGRFVEYKHVDTIIRAAALLIPRHPALRVMLVGSGPEESALRRLAANEGVADRVEFLGKGDRQSFAYEAIRASDVFCLPSTVEGFGIVVPEAMAAGVPVVCSDIPALRWVSGDGTHARLFRPCDHQSLADAIEACLSEDRDAARRRTDAAREWAEQFSTDRVTRTVERLLEAVVAANPAAYAGSGSDIPVR